MPSRIVVARELAEIFKAIAHPDRIRMIEELRQGELDVNTLAERLDLSGPRASQHLGLLRLHRIVEDRRDGRRAVYHLVQPEFAAWIAEALEFIEGRNRPVGADSIDLARRLWSGTASSEEEAAEHAADVEPVDRGWNERNH